jgi:hypothetical protein
MHGAIMSIGYKMKRELFLWFVLCSATLVGAASTAQSQTWVCDAEAVVGFDGSSRYRVINFNADRSYILRGDVKPEDLTLDTDRNHPVFNSDDANFAPVSLQQRGQPLVVLCTKHSYSMPNFNSPSEAGNEVNNITCTKTIFYGDRFEVNLNNGRFSHVATGFESDGEGQSWVEVGECRRTM